MHPDFYVPLLRQQSTGHAESLSTTCSAQQWMINLRPKKKKNVQTIILIMHCKKSEEWWVWKRHCKALFRKQVLLLLYNPTPLLNVGGSTMSMFLLGLISFSVTLIISGFTW